MQQIEFNKAAQMYMEVDCADDGKCNICHLAGSRPHAHPAYELSMWFPPVVTEKE